MINARDAVRTSFPLELNCADCDQNLCGSVLPDGAFDGIGQTRTVRSQLAVRSCSLAWLNSACMTRSSWSNGSETGAPVAAFHTLAVKSAEAVRRCSPSGLKTAA